MAPFTGTVGVTGLNATDNPGPGVAVATALRHHPDFHGRIVGLAYDSLDPGLYLPGLFDAAFLIPYPSTGRAALLGRLEYVRETEGLDVLIPTLDSELPALLGQEATLEALGIRTFLPTRAQHDERAKANLDLLRSRHDIPVPQCETLVSADDLYTLHERMDFPVVVKSLFYGAKVAQTLDEAVAAFHMAAAKWGLPIIVQRFVAGEEYNVAAIGDGRGGVVGAVPMKKLMLTDSGKGWAGVTIADRPLLALTDRIMKALKWRGPCEIEVMRDRDGGLHLMEINPRFPAWIELTAGAGQNLPFAYVQLAMGEAVTLPPFKVGAAFVRASTNTLIDISALDAISTAGEMLSTRSST